MDIRISECEKFHIFIVLETNHGKTHTHTHNTAHCGKSNQHELKTESNAILMRSILLSSIKSEFFYTNSRDVQTISIIGMPAENKSK